MTDDLHLRIQTQYLPIESLVLIHYPNTFNFQVSAMWWDQNEEYSQFTGDHAFLYKGYSLLTEALAEGLDIQLSKEVSSIVGFYHVTFM